MSAREALHLALQRCLGRRLTFAAFRIPGQAPELWAQRTPALETVDSALLGELNGVFLIGAFHPDVARLPFIRSDVELAFGPLAPDITALWDCQGADAVGHPLPEATAEAGLLRAADGAVRAMQRGELEKVVLSRVLRAPLQQLDLPAVVLRAMDAHPGAFVAVVHTPEHGTWAGASPERLITAEGDRVEVDALAGTLPITDAPAEPASWGAKERHEQEVVTRAVCAALGGSGRTALTVQGPEVVRSGAVAHLRTRVAADLGGRTLGEVLVELHPTPAVCGWPRSAAADLIARSEVHDRGLYAGFWGPWAPDARTDLYVNLRCMQVSGGSAALYAGAGLTAGSDPQREWAEMGSKAATWLRLIAEKH